MEVTKMNVIKYYAPKGEYITFASEEEYADKGRSWGLFAKSPKKQFWYKTASSQSLVTIKGYEEYKNLNVLVVEFEDGKLTCIHPSFLKEMQGGGFGKEQMSMEIEGVEDGERLITEVEATKKESKVKEKAAVDKAAPKRPKEPKEKKEKKEKLELPLEKVKFTAKVKEFATKPNPFSDRDDEVILLEEVVITGELSLVIGDAWCGYSNTLKAIGLEEGDSIEFEGKVVDKKFNKEILYKVNNPSKITKK